ncbi:transcription termination factor MTEF18, mitochondrial-like [Carex rostrata]
MSTTILFLRKLPRIRPSLPLTNLTSSFYRLLSTAVTTRSPPPNPHFVAVDYLIQSYGLPSDGALRASKVIQHLKSPHKPDAVLCFLRQTGISESDIRTAVSREPRLLVSDVEKNLRPNVVKLQEIGLSIEDISGIISHSPELFLFNIVEKIDFWMRALGSFKNMSVLLKKGSVILLYNLEKVIVPNLSVLQNQCGLSVCQIVQLIKSGSRLIGLRPEAMKVMVKRAEELGFSCSSQMFVYALITVASVNKNILNSRVHYFKSLGLSQEEVAIVISKAPLLLKMTEESLGRKMEFLMEEAGCGKIDVVHNPTLLLYSMEKRLFPRSIVRKMLMLKGLPVANKAFVSFFQPSEKDFLEKFVIPYESDIPGLGQAYADAYSGNTGANK